MILPALLLQQPSKTSKTKDHSSKIEIRFQLWKDGNILDLLREGRTILERLQNSKSKNKRYEAKRFSNLTMHGKINAAVRMLLNWNTGIHSVNDKVLKELQNKHSDLSPFKEGAFATWSYKLSFPILI